MKQLILIFVLLLTSCKTYYKFSFGPYFFDKDGEVYSTFRTYKYLKSNDSLLFSKCDTMREWSYVPIITGR